MSDAQKLACMLKGIQNSKESDEMKEVQEALESRKRAFDKFKETHMNRCCEHCKRIIDPGEEVWTRDNELTTTTPVFCSETCVAEHLGYLPIDLEFAEELKGYAQLFPKR